MVLENIYIMWSETLLFCYGKHKKQFWLLILTGILWSWLQNLKTVNSTHFFLFLDFFSVKKSRCTAPMKVFRTFHIFSLKHLLLLKHKWIKVRPIKLYSHIFIGNIWNFAASHNSLNTACSWNSQLSKEKSVCTFLRYRTSITR